VADEERGLMTLPSGAKAGKKSIVVDFGRVYEDIIKKAIEEYNEKHKNSIILPIRADDVKKSGSILADVIKRICQSDLVITDITGYNPNVLLECGLRLAVRNSVHILIRHKDVALPFDLTDERCIEYSDDYNETVKAQKDLLEFLESDTEAGGSSTPSSFFGPIAVHTGQKQTAELLDVLRTSVPLMAEMTSTLSAAKLNLKLKIRIWDFLEKVGDALRKDPAGQGAAIQHFELLSGIAGLDRETLIKLYMDLAELYSAQGTKEKAAEYSAKIEALESE
jgi:hypothetical protein